MRDALQDVADTPWVVKPREEDEPQVDAAERLDAALSAEVLAVGGARKFYMFEPGAHESSGLGTSRCRWNDPKR